MKLTRWNVGVLDFISLEIIFDDDSRKTWDYDPLYFPSLDALKRNMAQDFAEKLENCSEVTIYITNGTEHHTVTVDLPDATGIDFADYIFEPHIGGIS